MKKYINISSSQNYTYANIVIKFIFKLNVTRILNSNMWNVLLKNIYM